VFEIDINDINLLVKLLRKTLKITKYDFTSSQTNQVISDMSLFANICSSYDCC